jgi:hypothetical protein
MDAGSVAYYIEKAVFLIGIVGDGVQLGLLGTAATNRPTLPAPGNYDDGAIGGMKIDRGNRSSRRKPAPVPLCPPQTPHACPDANLCSRGGKRRLFTIEIFVGIIHGRWRRTSAFIYHSIIRRTGKEYERKQGNLIIRNM